VVTGSGLKVPDSIAEALKPRLSASWDLVSMDEKALGPLGSTKIQLLEILGPGPSYGYSMWRQLDVRFGEKISLQAVYQHISELCAMGIVEKDSRTPGKNRGRKRNYFRLTPRGMRIFTSLDSIRDSLLDRGID
jgi:DNA-binding PadR family transcriptional regulator